MKFTRGGAKDVPFAQGWAVDAFWPGLGAIATALGGAPWVNPTFRGNTGNVVGALVGAGQTLAQLNGRITAHLGTGVVNHNLLMFPASPRLARPLLGRYVNPDTMVHVWEASCRFQSPGATVLALSLGLQKGTSAQTGQWSTNAPGATDGRGIAVTFDGAGGLMARRKRTFATDATMTNLGVPVLPAGMTATDWLRWMFVIIAATPSQNARFRMYLENVLQFETSWDADGNGTGNNLPNYTTGDNTGFFMLGALARSDLTAGVLLDVTDMRYRMGRYDPVSGIEIPRT